MIPHSWVIEFKKVFVIVSYVTEFLKQSVEAWETALTTCKQTLGTVKYEQIFQGTGLSPLMYDLCMIPLISKNWLRLGSREIRINHLLFKDDLKLFWKTHEQNDFPVRTVHTFGKDKEKEFGIKKFGVITSHKQNVVTPEWN